MLVTDIPIWTNCPAAYRAAIPRYMEIRHDAEAEDWKTSPVVIWDPTQERHVDIPRDKFDVKTIKAAVRNLEGLRGMPLQALSS